MTAIVVFLLGGGSIFVVLFLIFILYPEKIDKSGALLLRFLAQMRVFARKARKKYVQLDLQGRVNSFTRKVRKLAPYLPDVRVKVEYVGQDIDRESFLKEGQVILRLREQDPDEMNFVHGSYMFVSRTLLHEVKRYISKSHRESIDLFVTTALFEREKPAVRGIFLDEYLHPKTADPTSKVVAYFNSYAKIDEGGFFFPVYLQELKYLGDKVFGKRKDDQIIGEVNDLIEFLEKVAERTIGDEVDLDFCRDYCKVAIVIVGRPYNITEGGEIWVNFIEKRLVPQHIETIYLIGPPANQGVIDNVCEALADRYSIARSRTAKVRFRRAEGHPKVEMEQYLVILRLQGAKIFQPA